MDFAFTQEQEELRATARAFLEEHSSSEAVRRAMESESGHDAGLWKQLGSELGWTAVHIPEQYGGLGMGTLELVALLEVMGERLVCSPFFSTVCLAANAILCAASEAQKREWLPAIAGGQATATLAYTGVNGRWDARAVEATAQVDADGFVLRGTKRYVPDGKSAEWLLVAARAPGSEGEAGIDLFRISAESEGLERRWLPTMDQTRKQAELVLNEVRVEGAARLAATDVGAGWPGLRKALERAAIAVAAEQVGGAQACLELSVQYAKEREQFGRPIGSFQAIKHKCADMMVLIESARSAIYYAACVADEDSDELPAVASLAKAWCSDAYFRCAAESIQIHGGVGFTWEYDPHLYFKRAKSSETFLGDAAYHRELVAQRIGL